MGAPADPGLYVPFLLRDRLHLRRLKEAPTGEDILLASPVGQVFVRDEGPYGDGPTAARLTVVDIDAATGVPRQGARLVHSGRRRRPTYDVDAAALDPDAAVEDFESDAFIQVSAFASAMQALLFVERPDLLGRRVTWAFPAARLTVIPRAGEGENAYYDRASGSVRFFSYRAADGSVRHSVLSSDVVSHETAHAVIDGIAPDLYDAITPQSLAIHESIADLVAIGLNLANETIVFSLFAISGGLLDVPGALSRIAEEFGSDLRGAGRGDYLRAARNGLTIDHVDRDDPHAVGEVLSGALYQVFLRVSDTLTPDDSGAHIHTAGQRLARMVFPALDYLPPGEASIPDLARAVVARSRTQGRRYPDADWFVEELVARGLLTSALVATELADPTDLDLGDVDLEALATDDAVARSFAEHHRTRLGIPARVRFEVLARDVARRAATATSQPRGHGELMFRVRWLHTEEHDLGPGFERRWAVPMGTTMVIDQDRRVVRSILTTDRSDEQVDDRTLLLERWIDDGVLAPADTADAAPEGALALTTRRGRQRVTGGARLLHARGVRNVRG